jgi:hypothetical protein
MAICENKSFSCLRKLPSGERIPIYYKMTPLRRQMDEYDDFYHFCTIVSDQYFVKVVALYESLSKRLQIHMMIIQNKKMTGHGDLSITFYTAFTSLIVR